MDDLECLDLVDPALDDHLGILRVIHQVIQAVDESLRDVALGHDVGVLAAVDVQGHLVARARLAPEADLARGMASDAQPGRCRHRQVRVGVDQAHDLVADILGRLALDSRIEEFRSVQGDLDLLAARQHGRLAGLVLGRVGNVHRQVLVELQVPAAADADSRRVANAVEIDHVLARREDQDAARERVGDEQILAVIGHGRRRADAPRPLGLGELHEVRLADDQVGLGTVLCRDLVVDQDAVVARIGHEQTLVHHQREAREVQRPGAAARVAHLVGIQLRALGRQRDHERHVGRGRLVLASASVVVQRPDRIAKRRCVVGLAGGEVGLPDHHVRAGKVLRRHGVIDHDPVEAKIGDEQTPLRDSHADRVEQVLVVWIVDALGQVRLVPRVQVGLAQDEVRRLAVRGRDRVPDQDPAVLGVGHEQAPAIEPHALRPAHAAGRGFWGKAAEVGLAEHDVRWRAADGRDRVPQQDAVVVGVSDRQDNPVAVHGGGVVEAGHVRQVRRRGGVEVRLPQHDVGESDASRAERVLRQQQVGLRHEAGDVVVDQDAVVDRARAEPVAVGHEEPVGRVGNALRRPEHLAAGDRVLASEALLADDQPRAVVVHPLRPAGADQDRNRALPRRRSQRERQGARQRSQEPHLESLHAHPAPPQTAFTSPPSIIKDEPVT